MADSSSSRRLARLEDAYERTRSGDALNPDSLREELEETAADETSVATVGRYLEKTVTEVNEAFHTKTATSITEFTELDELPEELLEAGARDRFHLIGEIGKGAAGRVYAMRDNSLSRTVAVKFLQKGREKKRGVKRQFINEARVTAMLEHPNIMPVYDIGVTEKNEIFFIMRQVGGCSIGDAIRSVKAGEPVPEEFNSLDGRVRIFLKICDALAYSNHKGFVHQDVKPDNIMLGEFGEVLLLDWGSALNLNRGGPGGKNLFGTPAYMSPEQARREQADERSDVYCLGASFFHALFLRHPIWAEDPDEFWEKKRKGQIDPIADEERKRVPAALAAIALKAMHADPAQRYQTVNEMADDLKLYQAGRAVSAYRETLVESFLRWYHNNQRVFWIVCVASVMISGVGGILFREKLKELMTWRLYYTDNFAYPSSTALAEHWKGTVSYDWEDFLVEPFSDSSGWQIKNNALHGRNSYGTHNISFNRDVPGDIRVEWTATTLRQPLNLNCFLGAENRRGGYTFHIGGFGNPRTVRLTKGSNFQALADYTLDQGIAVGREYRFRMEKEGQRIRLYQDGKKLIDYRDVDDLSGEGYQRFGFEVNQGNHIRIDDVVVYYHPLPLKVSPLAAADRFYQRGYYREALSQYREIIQLHGGHPIAVEAQFKAGRCLQQMDSATQALEAFERFGEQYPKHELAPRAMFERSRIIEAQGDVPAAEKLLIEMGERYPGHMILRTVLFEMTDDLRNQWRRRQRRWDEGVFVDSTYHTWLVESSRRLQRWGKRFSIDLAGNPFLSDAGLMLFNEGKIGFGGLVSLFPRQRETQAECLLTLGEFERITVKYADRLELSANAWHYMGHYRRVLREYPLERIACARSLVALGRFEEVLERYPDRVHQSALALRGLGRFEESFTRELDVTAAQAAARLGWQARYLERVKHANISYLWALLTFGRPDKVLQEFAGSDVPNDMQYYLALRDAYVGVGRGEDYLQRYGQQHSLRELLAAVYVMLGRADEALALYGDNAAIRGRVLLSQGRYDEVLKEHAADDMHWLPAYWATNRAKQLLEKYPRRRNLCAAVLLSMNRFKQVVDKYPEQREAAAKALYRLRRYADILESYPDQREICARALYRMDRPAEALRRYPESRSHYAEYLLSKGRYQDVIDSFPNQLWQYSRALLALGQAQEAPTHQGTFRLTPNRAYEFIGLQALKAYADGDSQRAFELLDERRVYSFGWHQHRFQRFLLVPILEALEGDKAALERARGYVEKYFRMHHNQRLYHEAAYLDGAIDKASFLDQPHQYFVRERQVLFEAIRLDIDGRHKAALSKYRAIAGAPQCRDPFMVQIDQVGGTTIGEPLLFDSEVVQALVRWRLAELKKRLSNAPRTFLPPRPNPLG